MKTPPLQKLRIIGLLIAGVGFGAVTEAAAQPQLRARGITLPVSSGFRTASSGPLSATSQYSFSTGIGGSARGSGSANFGTLSVNGDGRNAGEGGGDAEWRDVVTITAPGLEGTVVSVTFKLRINGNLVSVGTTCTNPQGGSNSFAAYQLYIGDNDLFAADSYRRYWSGFEEGANFLNQEITTPAVAVVAGQAFNLRAFLTGYTTGRCRGEGKVNLQMVWSGVGSVTANGNPVSNYTVSSATARNYSQPITTLGMIYDAWAAGYNLTAGNALPNADPDGDGFINSSEYALGQNPTTPDAPAAQRLVTTENGVPYPTVGFARPGGVERRSDIVYEPQRPAGPGFTGWTGNGVFQSVVQQPDGTELMTVRSTQPPTHGRPEIFRLVLNQAPPPVTDAKTDEVEGTGGTSSITEPAGAVTVSCTGSSDTHLSVPFTRAAAFRGSIQSVSGSTITLSGAPQFAPNQFVYSAPDQRNRYYVLIGPAGTANPKEGRIYRIVGNGNNNITVDTTMDDLSGIPAGAQATVIPSWTPATLFPAGDAGVSFTATTSSADYKTQLVVPGGATYFFSHNVDGTTNNIGWRVVGDNFTSRDDDALAPNSYFVVRNNAGTPTLSLVAGGQVLTQKVATALRTNTGSPADNPAALLRPFDVPLVATGLRPDNGFSGSDQLLVYRNGTTGFNPAPDAIYLRDAAATAGGWRLVGDGNRDHSADVIPPTAALVVRKAPASGQTTFWINSNPLLAVSAVSRTTHGGQAPFDVNLALNGNFTVEPRNIGTGYQVIVRFTAPTTFDAAAVASGNASISSVSGSGTDEAVINLSSAANAQRLVLSLLNANDGSNANEVVIPLAVLVADVNGDGVVNGGDAIQTRNRSGQPTDALNFRADLNADGVINGGDAIVVRGRSGTALDSGESADVQ
jgi:uncharacterized protein (TIGR02597 family)